jgi:hypothetical protein
LRTEHIQDRPSAHTTSAADFKRSTAAQCTTHAQQLPGLYLPLKCRPHGIVHQSVLEPIQQHSLRF